MKRTFLLIACTLCLFSCKQPQNESEKAVTTSAEITYPQAEYDQAKVVLMHKPEEELTCGVLHPDAALYKSYFNVEEAQKEHVNYQKILSNCGLQVYTLRNILLKDCVDKYGNYIECEATNDLRNLAASCITFEGENIDVEKTEAYRQQMLKQYTPNDLVRIIFQHPTISLKRTEINTGLEAYYTFKPLMNLFFMRDQMITTSKGIVIGKMNSSQRSQECDVIEFALNKIGHRPIYRIQGEDAFLEGGDFIPTQDYAMIGKGLRTNQAAINQLMDNDLLGKDTLVVVCDPWRSQIQMHLDTYFNVIDKDLVTLCQNRYDAKENDKDFLTVEIYAKDQGGKYNLVKEGLSFKHFLADRGIEIIPISPEDEDHFANNFLCVRGREIVMVEGQSEKLQRTLAEKGVTVHWAPLYNLTCGYGAAHCMTQVIGRSKN